jgi:hypothetical protein
MPLDPAREWLAAGITGIARGREWDAVVLAEALGAPGDEAEFVALDDGRLLVEGGQLDATPFAAALASSIEPPYRAVAVRRPDRWVVGARSIRVYEASGELRGDEFEIVCTAEGTSTRVDGMPSDALLPELEQLGAIRAKTFVVRARRLVGRLLEVVVEPL